MKNGLENLNLQISTIEIDRVLIEFVFVYS